jgi:hypothetical protein
MTPGARWGRKLICGVVAGGAGGALMSISTNAEMRLRRRPPSRVPAQTIERFLPVEFGEAAERRLTTVGHIATSAALGATRGVLGMAQIPHGLAASAFTTLAFLPDFVIVPALGDVAPPWRWPAVELGVSVLHHAVYAGATNLAYAAIERRIGQEPLIASRGAGSPGTRPRET